MKKEHKKMYKAGKNWVVATLVTTSISVAIGISFTDHINAKAASVDVTGTTNNTTGNTNTTTGTTGTNNGTTSTTTGTNNGTTNTTTGTNNGTTNTTTGTNNGTTNTTTGTNNETTNTTTGTNNGTTNTTTGKTSTTNATANNGTTNTTATDKSTNNQAGANNGTTQTGSNLTTGQTFTITLNNGTTQTGDNYNTQTGTAKSVIDTNNGSGDNNGNVPTFIQNINGHNMYKYPDGTFAKSTLIQIDGKNYYFDSNGYLTDLSNYTPTFFTTSVKNNPQIAIYKQSEKYITNYDGFITAESWYRPKQILKDGKKWTNSKSKDFRPILSVWWPNKNIQTNYINYMNKLGLANTIVDKSSTQDELDAAVSDIQKNIEIKISSNKGNVDWLKKDINKFIKTQSEWNLKSENYHSNPNFTDPVDGFQGGTLLYQNGSLTPYANSKYRILNKNPSNQESSTNFDDPSTGNEFLLGNDVDNSNPVVQAEDLNWLYYLMNFGKITQNDPEANFDSIRIDAVDNVDTDVANIASQYLNDLYKTSVSAKNANNHLSILEDWSQNDPKYLKKHNFNQITIDSKFRNNVSAALQGNPQQRANLSILINTLVNRENDITENSSLPNYEIVRAHDAGVQNDIANIIHTEYPNSTGYNITKNQLKNAFEIYDKDEKSTDKKYTEYNIPSSYALMLTNKDTIPRVYYGDMYTDDGNFMANKKPYFNTIYTMLKGRIKYVAGGQSMKVVNITGENSVTNNSNIKNQILTSVRYGKGALSKNDKGSSITRKSGIVTIESNDPNLRLSDNDKVIINVGAAHKNQVYRPLIDSSSKGINSYSSDSSTKLRLKTNEQGQLILTKKQISGYSNPQVSGYLSMWVPVGASKRQDIRTNPSNKKNKNGRIINSNAATDSNVIFEGFSNFQSLPSKTSQYENVILPKKTNFFKNIGVTYMELPPQYRSVTNNAFVDSVVQNGYAFNDRYDLGFKKPTKYGTAKQLANTIKAFHKRGIKVLADYVPNQLYSLPKQQVVKATKVDIYGRPVPGSNIYESYYLSNTVGNGKDYQAKYGGKFLGILRNKYPNLFKTKQISTGKVIDSSVKIKKWIGRYFNGTNVQGRGAYFVLNNINNTGYFVVPTKDNISIKTPFLPKNILGQSFNYGLYKDGNNIKYVTSSGYNAVNAFYKDNNGKVYYFDNNGNMINKPSRINGKDYYFLSDGVNLNNFIKNDGNGNMSYYSGSGYKVTTPGYYSIDGSNFFYVQSNGNLLTGIHIMDPHSNAKQYFNDEGMQLKGVILNANGSKLYLDPNTGASVNNRFITYQGKTYYAGNDGYFVTGSQKINGYSMYFNPDNSQVKNQIINNGNNSYYYDSIGHLVTNQDINVNGVNYHAAADGTLSAE